MCFGIKDNENLDKYIYTHWKISDAVDSKLENLFHPPSPCDHSEQPGIEPSCDAS